MVDVIGVAGVSRKTFYELFESKEDCFLAAYDVLLENILGDAANAFESRPGSPGRRGSPPPWGRCSIISPRTPTRLASRSSRCWPRAQGAGPARRRAAPVHRLPRVGSLRDLGRPAGDHLGRGRRRINELLYSEILHGAAGRLPSRLPDLMFWVTLPFLGAERAAAERERARLAKLHLLSARRSAPFATTAGLRIGRGGSLTRWRDVQDTFRRHRTQDGQAAKERYRDMRKYLILTMALAALLAVSVAGIATGATSR